MFKNLLTFFKSAGAERFVTILAGPGMAAAAMLLSFTILVRVPLTTFPEIERACTISGLAAFNCIKEAHAAGLWSVVGFLSALGVFFLVGVVTKRDVPKISPIHPVLTETLILCALVLVSAHLIATNIAPAYGSRIVELTHFSLFISLENLAWPFLIQLLLLEKTPRLRAALSAVLLVIMILSPYRSVALAIVVFGFMLPLAYSAISWLRKGTQRQVGWELGQRFLVVVVVAGASLLNGAIDSEQRAVAATPVRVVSANAQTREASANLGTLRRLEQRLAYPFYQAAIVEHLAATTALPTIKDALEEKFRLSNKPSLNEFAYRAIYPSQGAHSGQTTSLYYGEGMAYFGHAAIWAVCGPLLFALAWLLLSRSGIETSAILSIGIWRSSFAGLITILPAILLQVFGMAVVTYISRVILRSASIGQRLKRASSPLLFAVMLAFTVLQVVNSVHEYQRKSLVQVNFAPALGCKFVGGVPDLQHSMDHAVARRGLNIKSVVTRFTTTRLGFTLPYGNELSNDLRNLALAMSPYVTCRGALPKVPISVVSKQDVSAVGLIALNVIITGFLLLSAGLFWPRGSRGRRFTFLSST